MYSILTVVATKLILQTRIFPTSSPFFHKQFSVIYCDLSSASLRWSGDVHLGAEGTSNHLFSSSLFMSQFSPCLHSLLGLEVCKYHFPLKVFQLSVGSFPIFQPFLHPIFMGLKTPPVMKSNLGLLYLGMQSLLIKGLY